MWKRTGTSKILQSILLWVGALMSPASAHPVHSSTGYATMAGEADFITIATPIAREEVNQSARLPGRTFNTGDPVPAVEIHTSFRIIFAFKSGSSQVDSTFTLVHYVRRPTQGIFVMVGQPPKLVDFEPLDNSTFLMFLRRRSDGRFEGVTPTSPGDNIEKLTPLANFYFSQPAPPANTVLQPPAPREDRK